MSKIFPSLSSSGLVPLHNACSYGHYEVTELLIKHGACVNVADLWKFTPLHEAAAKGKFEICKLLLKVGTQVRYQVCILGRECLAGTLTTVKPILLFRVLLDNEF
ncbi:hypothetical protein DPMN_167423 [Dreissena polymorpha]|uniref:Tankyrase n=1 Tax=Dreissena polymorpha TaxID=45954 RepID=A0A9D4F0C3_DREPO|nr:hypothetical protein DPMN_167423 [Dreissena polymorpha]